MVKRVKKTKLPKFKTMTLKVGVFADKTYTDGTRVADVARWNEYGTKTAPPRPFFRNAIDKYGDSWVNTLKARVVANNGDIEMAMNEVGEMIINDIKDSIESGTYIANTPITLLLKERFPSNPEDVTLKDLLKAAQDVDNGITATSGHNKPLIWSATLLRSITKLVEK